MTDHRECNFLCNVMEIIVALLYVRLSGSKVRTDETEGRVVEAESDRNAAFVSGRSAQSGLHRYHTEIPVKTEDSQSDYYI